MVPRLRSCLSTPLISDDKLVGVLSLYARNRDAFSDDHQRLVEIVARQVSTVLQRSIAYASSSLRSFRDPLTDLPNVEHLRQLGSEQNQVADLPAPTALIHIDVKEVQKSSRGYSVGDQALRDLVRHLAKNLRAADVLFRLENDEFAVLLFQTDKETAGVIATRMKASVEELSKTGANKVNVGVTITVMAVPEDGDQIDSLIDAARKNVSGHRKSPSSSSESVH
jgi:diguanylate cyclase (GGDEF)-like protein